MDEKREEDPAAGGAAEPEEILFSLHSNTLFTNTFPRLKSGKRVLIHSNA